MSAQYIHQQNSSVLHEAQNARAHAAVSIHRHLLYVCTSSKLFAEIFRATHTVMFYKVLFPDKLSSQLQ